MAVKDLCNTTVTSLSRMHQTATSEGRRFAITLHTIPCTISERRGGTHCKVIARRGSIVGELLYSDPAFATPLS